MRTMLLLLMACLGFVLARGTNVQTGGPTLKKVTEFDLPGPAGKRFDYLAIDTDDHYLFSAHLAAGQTYVIDLRTNKVMATVSDTPGVEGIEYVAELKKFYTSNAGDNTIGVVDLRQMKVVKKIPTEKKPDGSAYAPPFHKLYVSDERGKAEAIVDVIKDELIKTLHFDSETGMPQYPEHYRKIEDFKVPHAIHTLAVDPQTHRVYTPEQEADGKPVARMVVYDAVTKP
jgi:DNA-binding beta-propeller fold protein YncE